MEHRQNSSKRRACTRCAVAKARCLPSATADCARCLRLGRDCIMQPEPNHKPRRSSGRKTRVAQLESRLDSLVHLLKTQNIPEPDQYPMMTPEVSASSSSSSDGNHAANNEPTPVAVEETLVPTDSSTRWPTDSQAEISLDLYRTNYARHFPFISISARDSAQGMQRSRPVLWKTIMMVTMSDLPNQIATGKEILQIVTSRMFLQAAYSLDLLEAIMVFVSWFHFHYLVNLQMTNLLHLAKALIVHLDISRSAYDIDRRRILLDGVDSVGQNQPKPPLRKTESIDGQRMLAACYVNCAGMSSSCHYQDTTVFHRLMDNCCKVLREVGTINDLASVFLVQVYRVLDSIREVQPTHSSYPEISPAPPSFHIKRLLSELQSLRENLPPRLQQDDVLMIHYEACRTGVFEVALLQDFPSMGPAVDDFSRMDLLYNCLLALKATLDLHSNLDITAYHCQALLTWSCINRCARTALKLSFLELPGWDLRQVREMLGLSTFLDKSIEKLRPLAAQRAQSDPDLASKEIFLHTIHTFEQIKVFYLATLKRTCEEATVGMGVEGFSATDLINSLDDDFWNGVMSENFPAGSVDYVQF